MSEEIKDIILDVKDSLNETPKNMYKYNKITLNLNEFEEILNYIEKLEKENFNIRENIHLERISLPPALTKDKDFMELYDIPSYEDLQQKVEQLEKELQTNVNKCNQLENIRKEAIKWVKLMGKYENGSCTRNFKLMSADFNYLLNILNKGE